MRNTFVTECATATGGDEAGGLAWGETPVGKVLEAVCLLVISGYQRSGGLEEQFIPRKDHSFYLLYIST